MLPNTYRKLIADHFSNNFREASKIVEAELKMPTGSEITIRNRYAGVNATDVNISAGLYTPSATPPIDLGAEMVGEVVAIGDKVTDYKVGDIIVSTAVGGYAEYLTVRSRFVLPVPEASQKWWRWWSAV